MALQEGYAWRVKEAKERDAWMLANLLQPHSRRTLRKEDFLTSPQTKAANREAFFQQVGEPDDA